MFNKLLRLISKLKPATPVLAHCDGPCGVYDPAVARVSAEAVLSLTKKIQALEAPALNDSQAWVAYQNTLTRYITIKEEQAQTVKNEILILWTDYFKPEHLAKHPELHEEIWNLAKLCSKTKVNIDQELASQLLDGVHKLHNMFWSTKGKTVEWHQAT